MNELVYDPKDWETECKCPDKKHKVVIPDSIKKKKKEEKKSNG